MKNSNNLYLAEFLLLILLIFKLSFVTAGNKYVSGTIEINWAENDGSSTDFLITSSNVSKASYFAFGLSKDNEMVINEINNELIN